jgi:hypothetical protein
MSSHVFFLSLVLLPSSNLLSLCIYQVCVEVCDVVQPLAFILFPDHHTTMGITTLEYYDIVYRSSVCLSVERETQHFLSYGRVLALLDAFGL